MRVTAIVIMGVAGSGKTTIGRLLAVRCGFAYVDADDLQPAANIAKLTSGSALDDRDREAWLYDIERKIEHARLHAEPIVLACSALKQAHRKALGIPRPDIRLVYLRVRLDIACRRAERRRDHFMPPSLVPSQFESLEEPSEALTIDAELPPEEIVRRIRVELGLACADRSHE